MPGTQHESGLHLHTSNRLETLAAALAEVTQTPLSSPFRAETIVVQSQGMARWLKQRLAGRHGICANIDFPFPNEMASSLFLSIFPELPAKPPFERDVMHWLVMKHLPVLIEEPAFAEPRRYLDGCGDLRKRHQLARKIAYLFDQYFIFRPDVIRAWDRGKDSQWQAELWRHIRPEIPHRHPAELHEQFARLVPQPGFDKCRLPERLCVFGISALPPFHLDLFTALGAHLPVHLFVVQPSRFYWGDITSGREEERLLKRHGREPAAAAGLHLERGNRLLASLGPLGRDFLKQIYSAGDWQEHDDFTEPEGNALLARVQSDILNLRDRGREESRGLDPTIDSPSPRPGIRSSAETSSAAPGRGSKVGRADVRAGNDSSEAQQTFLPLLWETASVSADQSTSEPLSPGDDSIQVHSCHSPLREMEVLHDHLLDWFNRDPYLAPRDIVVMMPDVEIYAPFVEAVFGSPEDESRRIPFRIADRGARQASQIVQTFLALLHLPQTRLGAATVLALLDSRAVRDRFGLSETDLELVRHWVEETHIRWGADSEHRARLELPALPENTWREGFDRLLLGYAMAAPAAQTSGLPYRSASGLRVVAAVDGRDAGGELPAASRRYGRPEVCATGKAGESGLFAGIAPYDDLEGDPALVLGRLAEFVQRLFDTVTDLGHSRRLHDWAARLQRVLDDFFQPGEEHERDLQTIRSSLTGLRRQHALSGFDDPVDLGVILEHLAPELEQDRHGAGFLSGGVTFCALKPMRSVPFKIICLAGMNDAVFPRPNAHLSFDLMAGAPRLGDRSTRNDDRFLFLETILSARERLYLSYVGQNIRDNSSIPPSVVVSELLDYIAQGFTLSDEAGAADYVLRLTDSGCEKRKAVKRNERSILDHLVTKHRLQAFHESYFQPNGSLFSFSAENCRASQAARRPDAIRAPFLSAPLGEPEPELRQITLDELTAFFCNPAAFLLQRRLHIRLSNADGALDEREPFDLDARDGYPLKQQLLQDRLAGIEPTQTLEQIAAAGVLPLGQVGQARSQSLSASVDVFWQRLQPFQPQRVGAALDVDLALAGFRLTGRVTPRAEGGVLGYRVASIKAPDILRLWIQHLAAGASGRDGESILVGADATHRYRPCEEASAALEHLLQLYWQGLRQPLKFFPRSSRAFAEAEHKRATNPRSRANPLAEALRQWEGNEFNHVSPERDDLSFNLCFGEASPLDEEFVTLALRVYSPVLQHETEEEA